MFLFPKSGVNAAGSYATKEDKIRAFPGQSIAGLPLTKRNGYWRGSDWDQKSRSTKKGVNIHKPLGLRQKTRAPRSGETETNQSARAITRVTYLGN